MTTATTNGKFSLDDYIDVAERISQFNAKYPDGTLQTICWTVEEVGGQTFIVYRAAAYRTPDDERPGHGIAWEPFPGKTPYTKDSELMNAETAAWGRAIVACGLTSNRKIASRQEVLARQDGNGNGSEPGTKQPTAAAPRESERAANAKQRGMLWAKARDAELTPVQFANVVMVAKGEQPRDTDDQDAANRWLNRELDRLPARLVDTVVEGIER